METNVQHVQCQQRRFGFHVSCESHPAPAPTCHLPFLHFPEAWIRHTRLPPSPFSKRMGGKRSHEYVRQATNEPRPNPAPPRPVLSTLSSEKEDKVRHTVAQYICPSELGWCGPLRCVSLWFGSDPFGRRAQSRWSHSPMTNRRTIGRLRFPNAHAGKRTNIIVLESDERHITQGQPNPRTNRFEKNNNNNNNNAGKDVSNLV